MASDFVGKIFQLPPGTHWHGETLQPDWEAHPYADWDHAIQELAEMGYTDVVETCIFVSRRMGGLNGKMTGNNDRAIFHDCVAVHECAIRLWKALKADNMQGVVSCSMEFGARTMLVQQRKLEPATAKGKQRFEMETTLHKLGTKSHSKEPPAKRRLAELVKRANEKYPGDRRKTQKVAWIASELDAAPNTVKKWLDSYHVNLV